MGTEGDDEEPLPLVKELLLSQWSEDVRTALVGKTQSYFLDGRTAGRGSSGNGALQNPSVGSWC